MNKELKFSMKFDTSDFDAAVTKMQQKLKEMAGLGKGPQAAQTGGAKPGVGAPGGADALLNKPAMESFYKSLNALRTNADSAMRSHAKEQMKLMKDIAKEEEHKYKLLIDQEKVTKNKTKDLNEELRIKKELKTTEEQLARLKSASGNSRTSFDAAQAVSKGQTVPVFVTNWPNRGGFGGGGRGPGGGGGEEGDDKGDGFNWKKMMSIKGVQSLMGMAAIAAAAGVVKDYGGMAIQKQSAQGGATQALAGNQLKELMSGSVISGMAWEKERKQAEKAAEKKLGSDQLSDTVLSGKSWMGAGASALGDLTSLGGTAENPVSKWLDKKGDEYFSALQSQQIAGKGQSYEESLAAQQKINANKTNAVDFYQGRFQQDLQSQRTMGLNDEDMYGRHGIMNQSTRGGFTGDMALQMGQSIQGAGGSTRSMSNNALLGNQAQRGYGLTNAGSILGTISGGAGGSEESERIFKRILTEGTKDGLDKSEAVEELRRFSQMTAEVVAKTGAYTESDAQHTIEGFARFQAGGNTTIKEQQGAQEAYQEYQGQTAATGGRGGAMQYSSMVKNGLADKLNPRQMGRLMEMPEEDVISTNPFIVSAASAAGMSPEEMVKQVKNSKRQGVAATAGIDPEWQKILEKNGVTDQLGETDLEDLKKMNPEAYDAYQNLQAAGGNVGDYGSAQKQSAKMRGYMSMGDVKSGQPLPGTEGVDQTLAGKTGRMGDEAIGAAAAASQKALENFRDFKDILVPSAEAVSKLTGQLKIMVDVINGTNAQDRASAIEGTSSNLHQGSPSQPQGSNGGEE